MSTKYCDHAAYAAYAATPSWGVPQDGDGTAKTAATASATISIDMATWVFTSGSSTISVMGATALTVGAGANSATNVQYSATLTTLIDNIVTVINTLATALIANKPTNWAAPQVRNAVFARRSGDFLELMTRTGSASWNGLVAMAFASVTNSASASWSGGSGGCWGYIINNAATIWASSVAVGGYGIWAAALPYAGYAAPGDVVKVRSKTLTMPNNSNVTWTMAAMGTALAPVRFDIDDGTEWPADGSTPVLKITSNHTSNTAKVWSHLNTCFAHVRGKKYSSGQRNLVMEATGQGPSIATNTFNWGGPIRVDCLHMHCPGTPTSTPGPQASGSNQVYNLFAGTAGAYTILTDLLIEQPGQVPGAAPILAGVNSGYNKLEVYGIEIKLAAASTAWVAPGVVQLSVQASRIMLDSLKCTGFVAGSRLHALTGFSYPNSSLVVRNADFGNVTVLGPSYLTAGYELDAGERGIFVIGQHNKREFAIDRSGRLYVEWNHAKGRPTLNALQMDGVTPWSIFAVPTTVPANISKISGVELPRIGKILPDAVDLAEAPRTLTFNFLLESNLAWTKQDISVVLDYMGADGVIRTMDTYDPDGGALDASTADWTTTSWNGQTWLKREFSVTTPVSVKAGTEIGAYFRLHTSVTNDTYGVIICPEVLVA